MTGFNTIHRLCFENKVSITEMLPIFGQGDWMLLNDDQQVTLEIVLDTDTRRHSTVERLLEKLKYGGDDIDELLELMFEKQEFGMFIVLSTPVPQDFFTIDKEVSKASTWRWTSSQGYRQTQIVYVTNLVELITIVPEFKKDVVSRALDKHLASLAAVPVAS